MAYMTDEQLRDMGFNSLGDNVLLSDKASFYNPAKISIGSNVRIDDFCILSAGEKGISIGSYIHIAAFSSLIGAEQIKLEDFCGLSSRVAIYSSSDDYSGNWMTNPMVPEKFTNVISKAVVIGKHVIIGCGSVVLPGVVIQEGTAIAAQSLVKKSCEPFSIYHGNPAKRILARKMGVKELEQEMLKEMISPCQKLK